jgi:hypothetical protein
MRHESIHIRHSTLTARHKRGSEATHDARQSRPRRAERHHPKGFCPKMGILGISWDYMAVKKSAQPPGGIPLRQINAINDG